MNRYIIFLLLFLSGTIEAQDYSIQAIPDSLKKDAYAVIRYEECVFSQSDVNNATEKETKVITVLNEKGKDLAHIHFLQDKFRKLKNFSGEIILESGKVFKKIGKGDLVTTAVSSNLADDNVWTYYYCSSPSYPFTLKYSYELEWKNGLAGYPVFAPMEPSVSLEKSVHQIQIPSSFSIHYKGNSVSPEPEKKTTNNGFSYTWVYENAPAITPEPLAPGFYSLTPLVYVAPDTFCYDGACGNMSTWQYTGQFLSQLLDKRDVLPPVIEAKVKELIKDNSTETVSSIYKYLQETMRYVSIQLGIGGFQPASAAQVAKTGFGDCKALTNYMKAMLNVAGIQSEYAIVHTEKKKMFPDFSSLNQANHVILLVPLGNDSIWLECTSKEYPFDYPHSGIAGHDVLLVSGEKSRLCTVRDNSAKMNMEINRIQIQLNPDASIRSQVQCSYKNQVIEEWLNFVINLSEKEKVNTLSRKLSVQRPQISDIQTDYVRSSLPEIHLGYTLESAMYANRTGARLLLPVNPFKFSVGKILTSSTRKYNIHIDSPISRTDSISLEIPAGYQMESMPKPVLLESPFGTFSVSVEENGSKYQFVYQVNIPAGEYPVARYPEIRKFFNDIDKNVAAKIMLKNTAGNT